MRLEGRRAVVTGAAGAVGRVIALALAAERADVVGVDLNANGLEDTAAQVKGAGRRTSSIAATSPTSTRCRTG